MKLEGRQSSFAYPQRQLCNVLWSHIKYVVSRTYKDRSLCGSIAASVVYITWEPWLITTYWNAKGEKWIVLTVKKVSDSCNDGISSLDSAWRLTVSPEKTIIHTHILYVHRRRPGTDRVWHIVRHRREETKTFLFLSDSRLGGSWLKFETLPMSLCSLQQSAVTLFTPISTLSAHLSTFAHVINESYYI